MDTPIVNITFLSLLEALLSFRLAPDILPVKTFTRALLTFSLVNYSIYFIYRVFIYPFFLSPLRHLPSPPNGGLPIFGHGFAMLKWPPGSPHLRMIKETENDGIVLVRSFFNAERLILSKPAAIAEVLVAKSYEFEKPPWIRAFLRKFLGDGLLVTEGDEHKHQRKQIMPAFSFRHIKELYPVFWSKSIQLCQVIKSELGDSNDKVLEFNHFTTQVTLDIIGLAGLGRDIGSLRNADDELIELYEEILEPTPEKGAYFVCHLLFPSKLIAWLPWKLNERVRITTSKLKQICIDFVRDKRARMKVEDKSHLDILSIMIRSNDFSDEGIVDQLLTFLAAGHETTSSALTWTAYLLATQPDVQRRLRTEIHDAIQDPETLSSPDVDIANLLESLPFLNAVCNETLRLYPTIPVSARHSTRDTSICGQFVPKNTDILIIPWATNRDPSIWGDDAESFRPDRWLDPTTGKANYVGGVDSNYSFLTFFHGPRSCIGQGFARAELRSLVAAFVGSFEMEMANPNAIVMPGGAVTIKPRDGLRLKLRPLDW
ncbi:cytochrome P450 [Aaosphaeria arxii CBS 175.79]|uniref:Cytochrome P450 n=1 Tax=Aaosphaeria arxii CBS 175.79 TaxID=1450172 RepID=A0A6A5XXL3_9PLEO|nr:cytochrome P450 [Aaosphaeria arxii CBS 175.79]KAF2017471.1 cytochrome P450 [Aaosphaeria arxii CBS 175.79]